MAPQGYPAPASYAPLQEQRRVFSDFPSGDYRGDNRAPLPPQQMEPLVGVGIVFRRNPQSRAFVVDRMYQDGPALRSQNVAQGDILVTVDQHPVEDVNSQRLHDLIAGRVGSTVTLGLQCDDGKFREVTLRRAHCNNIEPPRRVSSPPSSYAPPSRHRAPQSPIEEAESSGAEEEEESEAGIGVTFKKLESGLFFVGKISSGGPAARMGTQIQIQDILYKVDGAEVKGWDYKELANRIKGPVGSIVTMHFRRSGKPPHKAVVTRGHVSENPVSMRGKAVKSASSGSSSAKRSVPSKMSPKDGECGIGFAVKSDGDKGFFISKILPDSPAMECGRLHVGDRVRKIDGHRIEGLSLDRVKSLILGEEGSAMELVITDQQDRTSRHTILRRLVKGSVNSPIRPVKPVASSRPRSARPPPRDDGDYRAPGGASYGRPVSGRGYEQHYSPPAYGHPMSMYPPQPMEYYAPPPPPPYAGYPPHDPYRQPVYEQGYTPRGAPYQYPPPHGQMAQPPPPPSRQYRQDYGPAPSQQPVLSHQDDGYDAVDQDGEAGLWDV